VAGLQHFGAVTELFTFCRHSSTVFPWYLAEARASVRISTKRQRAYAEWCIRVKQAYKLAQAAIHEAQAEEQSENLWAGLQYVIIQDQEFPHLLSSTRLVCNALHRHFMLDNKRKHHNK